MRIIYNLTDAMESIAEWQEDTFPNRDGSRQKLLDEANELFDTTPGEAAEEAADVFFMLVSVCEAEGIDLLQAVKDKLAKNRERTWSFSDGTWSHDETTKPKTDAESDFTLEDAGIARLFVKSCRAWARSEGNPEALIDAVLPLPPAPVDEPKLRKAVAKAAPNFGNKNVPHVDLKKGGKR